MVALAPGIIFAGTVNWDLLPVALAAVSDRAVGARQAWLVGGVARPGDRCQVLPGAADRAHAPVVLAGAGVGSVRKVSPRCSRMAGGQRSVHARQLRRLVALLARSARNGRIFGSIRLA